MWFGFAKKVEGGQSMYAINRASKCYYSFAVILGLAQWWLAMPRSAD